MVEVFPNYYNKFKCIADKCKHSCCVGWEIDIDEETMGFYNSLDGEFGERVRKSIEGEVPHFVLREGDRCPFLNGNGLCDIICEYGENALCDICYLHPRFRNFYQSFYETGLGLCCEEAARIILSENERFSTAMPSNIGLTEDEKDFLAKRQEIFDVLQNRERSIAERFAELAKEFGFEFKFPLSGLCRIYLSLERLDDKWTDELNRMNGFSFDGSIFEDDDFGIVFEQLAVYFVFRHLSEAMRNGEYAQRVRFALVSCYFIGAMCSCCEELSFEKAADIVRMYSQEIEYSEENTEKLMNLCI